jgi:hypothetical protein
MKSAKLVSVLNELGKISKKYPTINCGGCGAFALYVSDELNKRNVKHDIAWIGDTFGNNNVKREIKKIFKNNSYVNLTEFNCNGIYLSHVMIKIKSNFIDSEGVFNGFNNTSWGYRQVITTIKTDELRMLVNNEEGWNNYFNRKNMPKLKKDIEKIMKKLDE